MHLHSEKTCIVIVGPTAVGKTSVAIELAKALNTDIISADSRQCYHELNIGVAKPLETQLQLVKHYFIDSHSIFEEVNAGLFEDYALSVAGQIFNRTDKVVMVGGTGLYINAFCEGIDEMPLILPDVRNEIKLNYEKFGLVWLQEQVKQNDPYYFEHGESLNPHRLIRSLEVKLSTGHSIRSFQKQQKKQREFSIRKIGLAVSREILYHNIDQRVDKMIENGLVDEASALLPHKQLNALNTVGYKEVFEYLEKRSSLDEAIKSIKQNSRRYAKRQLTWFNKDKSIRWFTPDDISAIWEYACS